MSNAAPFLRLLGAPSLDSGSGTPAAWLPQRPHQALAYLACCRQWVSRDALACWLWPERELAASRRNLRKVLMQARALAGPAALEEQADRLRWHVDSDVARLDAACAVGDAAAVTQTLPPPLMQGLEAGLSATAMDWLAAERQRRAQRWRDLALRRLAELADAPAEAAALCERLLVLDAFDDAAVIALARARSALGQGAEALRLLDDHLRRLHEEFALEPGPALLAARESLRARGGAASATPAPALPSSAAAATAASAGDAFVGRRGELQQLQRLLLQPGCRALTITGLGGIGKSTLAERAAPELAAQFPDGVLRLPAADLDHAGQLAERLCAALEFAPRIGADLWQQLAAHVGTRRMLWVLDSTEHLADLGAALAPVLAAAPALKLIATSRKRLAVPGEQMLPLEGLAVPDLDERDPAVLRAFDSVRLFEARALAVAPSFRLESQAADVAALVAAVEGLPLAIELAAPWVRLLPVADIVAELRRSPMLLDDDAASRGARALRDSFEHSWRLLPAPERQALARLAVLPDDVDREMAREVADAGLALLAALADASLLHPRDHGRFGLHPMVRAYARERAGDSTVLRQRHAAFVARRFSAWPLDAPRWRDFKRDISHVRGAWQTALGQRDAGVVADLARPLSAYFDSQGFATAGIEALTAAVQRFDGATEAEWPALCSALRNLALLERSAGRLNDAQAHARRALRLAQRLGDTRLAMGCLNTLGLAAWQSGRFGRARPYIEQALRLARQRDDEISVAAYLGNLALVQTAIGDYAGAVATHDEVLRLREGGESRASSLNDAATARRALGQLDAAAVLLTDALRICDDEDLPDMGSFVLMNLGAVALDRGDVHAARGWLERATAASQASSTVVIEAEIRLWRVIAEIDAGDAAAAGTWLRQSLAALAGSELTSLRLRWSVVLVRWLLAQRRDADAAALMQWADAQEGLSALDRADALRRVDSARLAALSQPAPALVGCGWPEVERRAHALLTAP